MWSNTENLLSSEYFCSGGHVGPSSMLSSSPLLTSWFCTAHLPRSIFSYLFCEFFPNCLNRSYLGISWNPQNTSTLIMGYRALVVCLLQLHLYVPISSGVLEPCITLPWFPTFTSIVPHKGRFPVPIYWRNEWVGIISHMSRQWNERRRGKGTELLRNRGEQRERNSPQSDTLSLIFRAR